MTLLNESDKYSSFMKGKLLLAFYGATGSGKSTSINYFMGIPLKKYDNGYGDKVVKIDE